MKGAREVMRFETFVWAPAVLLGLLFWGNVGRGGSPPHKLWRSFARGRGVAVDFRALPDVRGPLNSLSSLAGAKGFVLVEFWALWCEPAGERLPLLRAVFLAEKKSFKTEGGASEVPRDQNIDKNRGRERGECASFLKWAARAAFDRFLKSGWRRLLHGYEPGEDAKFLSDRFKKGLIRARQLRNFGAGRMSAKNRKKRSAAARTRRGKLVSFGKHLPAVQTTFRSKSPMRLFNGDVPKAAQRRQDVQSR